LGVGSGAEKGNLRLTPGENLAVANRVRGMRLRILCGIIARCQARPRTVPPQTGAHGPWPFVHSFVIDAIEG